VGFPAAEKKFQKIFLEFAWFFFKIGFFVQTLFKQEPYFPGNKIRIALPSASRHYAFNISFCMGFSDRNNVFCATLAHM